MNTKRLLSLVMPVYNAERFLERALESIANQTYKNFIVLLIDDGSTDRSAEICKKYVNKYCDNKESGLLFKYFFKENGGVSDARNYGLKYAELEYVTFMDSDDVIDPNHIENFINNIGNIEWIMQGMREIDEKGKVIKEYKNENNFFSTRDVFWDNNILKKTSAFDWVNNKMYKTNIIINNNIKFAIDTINSDRLFNIEYSKYINNFLMLNSCSYNYMYVHDSITHSYIHPVKFINSAKLHDKNLDYNKFNKEMQKYNIRFFSRFLMHALGLCIVSPLSKLTLKERTKLLSQIIKYFFNSNSFEKNRKYTVEKTLFNVFDFGVKLLKIIYIKISKNAS